MKEAKNLLINQSITREAVEELEYLCLDIYFIEKNALKKSRYIVGEDSCAVSISSWWRTY